MRIIPARAGFTAGQFGLAVRARDHPRSRGVYAPQDGAEGAVQGSSPLARGLPAYQRKRPGRLGIIPARAGFTGPDHLGWPGPADHPRSRGVYMISSAHSGSRRGSSPLARGLPGAVAVGGGVPGIIPARAGFTPAAHPQGGRPVDHPRSRGVYVWPACGRRAGRGSSPLARGLPCDRSYAPPFRGIIPARAGFTRPRCSAERARADHPRSRGVYRFALVCRGLCGGSSPLARGLRAQHQAASAQVGIIPARAGFT